MPSSPLFNKEQSSPFADLIKNALQSYGHGVQARYAPQTAQADIFSKEFAPLAEIASSPLALAMLPEQRQKMMELISKLLQQTGGGSELGNNFGNASGILGGAINNQPNQAGGMNGYYGGSSNSGGSVSGGGSSSGEFGSDNKASDQMVEDISLHGNDQYNNPNLPSTNLQTGVAQKSMGGYSEGIHSPGTTYATANGQQLQTPSPGTMQQSQDTLSAIKNFKDLAPGFLEHASEFAKPGANLRRVASATSAISQRLGAEPFSKLIGKVAKTDPEMVGRYHTFEGEKTRLGNILKTVYPTSTSLEALNKHLDMLELRSTDTEKSYSARVKQILSDLNVAEKNAKLSGGAAGGYNLSPTSGNIYGESHNKSAGGYDPLKILDYKYKGTRQQKADAFKESFNTLNAQSKALVLKEMRRRGGR